MDFTNVWGIEDKITQYGLFELHYHEGIPSSVGSDEPIWWWYNDLNNLLENSKDYSISSLEPQDYFKTMIDIHMWTKMLHKI